MNPYQKMAWYNLGVILFTAVVFITLYSATGHLYGSLSAFAAMALCGFSPLFLTQGQGGEPLDDEYHLEVRRRAWSASMLVFWFYFVIGSVGMTMHFSRSIPTAVYLAFFLGGFALVMTVNALAVLLIYSADFSARRTLLDRFRQMDPLRRGGLLPLVVFLVVGLPFLWVMTEARRGEVPASFMLNQDITFAVMYALASLIQGRTARTVAERETVRRARRRSYVAMGTNAAAALAAAGALAVLPSAPPVPWPWFGYYTVFIVLFTGLVTLPLSLVLGGGRARATRVETRSAGEGQ